MSAQQILDVTSTGIFQPLFDYLLGVIKFWSLLGITVAIWLIIIRVGTAWLTAIERRPPR